MKAKRAQSFRDSRRCELGIGVRCRCRCRGELHGRKRFGDEPTILDFAALDHEDPHWVKLTRRNRPRYVDVELPFEGTALDGHVWD
jgi:hypothetical protein